jgi:hypothetical protein
MSTNELTLSQKLQKVRDELPIGNWALDTHIQEAMKELGQAEHLNNARRAVMRSVCEIVAADRVAQTLIQGGSAEAAASVAVGDVAAEIGVLELYWDKEVTDEQRLADIDRQLIRMTWITNRLHQLRNMIAPQPEQEDAGDGV